MFYRITYNLILNLTYPILKFLGLFSNKLSLFIEGRKVVFDQLKSKGVNHGSWVWFHVASLGEFEQARPLISLYKKTFTEEKILLTFFSPSGFEVQKNAKKRIFSPFFWYQKLAWMGHDNLKITSVTRLRLQNDLYASDSYVVYFFRWI